MKVGMSVCEEYHGTGNVTRFKHVVSDYPNLVISKVICKTVMKGVFK